MVVGGDFDDPMNVGSVVYLLGIIVLILSGILVNWKFLRNMRDDDKDRGPNSNGILIRDVMETHTKTQMVITPTFLIFFWILRSGVEFPVWLHPSFCYVKFIVQTFKIYFAFNSLAIAAMRHTFIIHHNSVSLFGIENTKRLFYYGSILTPGMIAILSECTIKSPPEVRGIAYSLCIDSYHNNITDFNGNITQNITSPIYSFVHEYVSTEVTYYISIFVKICVWIIFGNVIEGILYWKTFTYIRK